MGHISQSGTEPSSVALYKTGHDSRAASSEFPNRSNTNRAVQAQKMAGDGKF